MNDLGDTCVRFGREESCMPGFVGKSKGKRPLRRPRQKMEIILKYICNN
jgi:hypothetical protein